MESYFLQDFSPLAIGDAIEHNLIGFTLAYAHMSHGLVHEEPGLTWVYTGTPFSHFNAVIHTNLTSPNLDSTIRKLLAFFQEMHQPMRWWITPSTRPTDLADLLLSYGLKLYSKDTGMAADLLNINQPLSIPSGITIEKVKNDKDLQHWVQVLGQGFEMNKQRIDSYEKIVMSVPLDHHPIGPFYLARLYGEPVATSALFCHDGVAGIYEVSTIPSARRQGIGASITLASMLDARDLGYRITILHATEMGESIYRHLGFNIYCTLDAYRWEPEFS